MADESNGLDSKINSDLDSKLKFNSQPTLSGDLVRLRPLQTDDFEKLFACASDPKIWEVHPQPERYKREVFEGFFKLAMESRGALAVFDAQSGEMIGSSRFYDADFETSSVVIGYTFLTREFWGGKHNGEMKKLMLNHAFECFKTVTFQIGKNNLRSRRAIEKIGAAFVSSRTLDGMEHVIYKIDRD